MLLKRCFLLINLLLFCFDAGHAQCPTPAIIAVHGSGSPVGAVVHYTSGIQGTYYFEFGPAGFTPGTDSLPGAGGSVYQVNGTAGMNLMGFPAAPPSVDCYVRVFCNNTSFTPNSDPYTVTPPFPISPAIIPVKVNLGTYYDVDFNMPGYQSSLYDVCGFQTGNEYRYRFDSTDSLIYEVEISVPNGSPLPNFAIKPLNDNTAASAYVCQSIASSSSNAARTILNYTVGPFDDGISYDLLFDSYDTTQYSIDFMVKCPAPKNITRTNITPTSIDLSWNCPCNDTVIVEYGPVGFVPGTGNSAGAAGTISVASSSPHTLSGLTSFTAYDIYTRTSCGSYFTQNKKIKATTAKDCSASPVLNCGDLATYVYQGTSGVKRGAWDLSTLCGASDSSEEKIYSFTPAQSGNYSIYVYSLTSNWNTYFYSVRFFIKEASLPCNETGWNCIGSLNSTVPTFAPQTLTFGPLTAGVTYLIAADANTYPSTRGYTFRFQLQCPGTCNGPVLSTVTGITPTTATVDVACTTCFTNGMIEYGSAGFTPGTGSTAGAGGTVVAGVTFPYTITGLTTGIAYDVYARSDCSAAGTGYSSNSGPLTFTPCSSPPTSVTTSSGTSNTGCFGDSITLYRNGGQLAPGSTFVWYSGSCGGTLVGTGDSIKVAPLTSTTYYVRAEGPCGNSACAARTITPTYQQLSINGNDTICQGQNTVMSASSSWPSYNWSTGATTASINVSFPAFLTLIVTAPGGCTDTAQATVVMLPLPSVGITGNASYCAGQSTVLDAGSGYSSYLWSTGATTQVINANVAGTYTVTVTSAQGCTATDSKAVTASPLPTPVITGNNTICTGSITTLNGGPGYFQYAWNIGSTTQTITVSTQGIYSVTVTDANGCTGTDSIFITVNPIPVVAITASGPTTFCRGDSVILQTNPGLGFWQWRRGNYLIPGATASSYTVKRKGNYSCIGTDSNGCYDTSNFIFVNVPCIQIGPNGNKSDAIEMTEDISVNVYPNPTSEDVTVETDCTGPLSISVTDLKGRRVGFTQTNESAGQFRIAGLPEGIFILSISCNGSYMQYKLVKIR